MQIRRALGKICAKNGIAAKRTQPAHCIHTQLRGCFQAIASQLHGSLFALALETGHHVFKRQAAGGLGLIAFGFWLNLDRGRGSGRGGRLDPLRTRRNGRAIPDGGRSLAWRRGLVGRGTLAEHATSS